MSMQYTLTRLVIEGHLLVHMHCMDNTCNMLEQELPHLHGIWTAWIQNHLTRMGCVTCSSQNSSARMLIARCLKLKRVHLYGNCDCNMLNLKVIRMDPHGCLQFLKPKSSNFHVIGSSSTAWDLCAIFERKNDLMCIISVAAVSCTCSQHQMPVQKAVSSPATCNILVRRHSHSPCAAFCGHAVHLHLHVCRRS